MPLARMARTTAFAAACLALVTLAGACASVGTEAVDARAVTAPSANTAKHAPLPVATLPGWEEDDLHGLHEALARQCATAQAPLRWPSLCTQLPAAKNLAGWIAEHFDAWPLIGANGAHDGLLTGYYEPILAGTRERLRADQAPLYARPADLVALTDGSRGRLRNGQPAGPYPTRAQIENDGLPGGKVLLWLDDPIEAFFLQVQGSGRVRLSDGSIVRVGFADHNGHAYHSIGRELIERGALAAKEVDAASIRTWLQAHPAQAREIMQTNPRYIFFRELPAPTASNAGPPGSLGVALEPMRSVATDPAFVPPGALLFIDSSHPESAAPLRRLVVSQDRGAAIVGAVRADLFWGSGAEAGRVAGRARQSMRMWLLWPKGEIPPGR